MYILLAIFRQIILCSRLLVSCVLCPSLSLRVHTLELMVESSMSEPLELRSQSSQWKVHRMHYTECVYYIYICTVTNIPILCAIMLTIIINPRRACAARVTVVVLCVCVSVHSISATTSKSKPRNDTNASSRQDKEN